MTGIRRKVQDQLKPGLWPDMGAGLGIPQEYVSRLQRVARTWGLSPERLELRLLATYRDVWEDWPPELRWRAAFNRLLVELANYMGRWRR